MEPPLTTAAGVGLLLLAVGFVRRKQVFIHIRFTGSIART